MTVFQTRKMLWHKVPVASILAPLASGYPTVMEKDSLPDVVSGVELVTDVNTHVVDHIMAFQDSLEFNWKYHINKCVYTVKPVLSGHSKIYKTKILMTNGSLMKVESIAECSHGAFRNTF